MASARVNLIIEQGVTWSQSFTWKVGDPLVIVDLTGFTARMQIRPSRCSSTIVADIGTANGGIVIDPLAGRFDVSMSSDVTGAIDGGLYVYDLEATSGGGEVSRVLGGAVSFSEEVTREDDSNG